MNSLLAEVPDCHETPCENGGSCLDYEYDDDTTESYCACPDSYTGYLCESKHSLLYFFPNKIRDLAKNTTNRVLKLNQLNQSLHVYNIDIWIEFCYSAFDFIQYQNSLYIYSRDTRLQKDPM